MTRQSLVYQGFAAGEYGSLPSWEAGYRLLRGHMVYAGRFTGRDMLRSINGALTPRVDVSTYTLTAKPAGTFGYCGPGYGGSGPVVWFTSTILGAVNVYSFNPMTPPATSQAVAHYAGTMPGTATYDGYVNDGTLTWVACNNANKIVKLDHVAQTVTNYAPPAGAGRVTGVCVRYGDRMLFVDSSPKNRVWYSAPHDFTDWSGTWSGGPGAGLNFFDVGDTSPIIGLYEQRGFLAIAKQATYGEGQWWSLTGVPGVNDTLRRVCQGPVPNPNATTLALNGGVTNSGDVVFQSGLGNSRASYPARFNGVSAAEERHLPFGVTNFGSVAWPLRGPNDWFMTATLPEGTQGIFIEKDGVPHLLTSPFHAGGVASFPEQDMHIFWDAVDFYVLSFYADTPLPDSSIRGTAGKAGNFTLPELAAFGDVEVACRGVFVDFTTYSGLPAGSNTFDVTLTPRRRLGQVNDSATQTLHFAQGQPGTASQQERNWFGFQTVFGGGFQLAFSAVRGVAIERVVAVYDERSRQAAA